MDGDWDCPRLDELATRLLVAGQDRTLEQRSAAALVDRALARVANLQTKARAKRDIRAHYDIGNDLYAAMLGRSWTYSGAYWRNAGEAQVPSTNSSAASWISGPASASSTSAAGGADSRSTRPPITASRWSV
jgi:hypothetical protein